MTSTDRSGFTGRPSQLISHQHPPFHSKNILLHSSFSVERCRGVATAVLIAQTPPGLQLHTPPVFMPRELDLLEKKEKKKNQATIARWTARGKAHIILFRADR